MTAPTDPGSADEDLAARRLDAAIDELLAGGSVASELDDGSVEATAIILGRALPRSHPRFGFEERLAQRLRGEAGGDGTIVPFPGTLPLDDDGAGPWRPGRWSVIGAIASGISVAVTLAGAVFVVLWRRTRGSDATEGMA